MNNLAWQQIITILCVAWAIWVLVRAGIRLFTAADNSGCGVGDCGSCSQTDTAGATGSPTNLVQLNSLNQAADNLDKLRT